jgi:hypothetical protein
VKKTFVFLCNTWNRTRCNNSRWSEEWEWAAGGILKGLNNLYSSLQMINQNRMPLTMHVARTGNKAYECLVENPVGHGSHGGPRRYNGGTLCRLIYKRCRRMSNLVRLLENCSELLQTQS